MPSFNGTLVFNGSYTNRECMIVRSNSNNVSILSEILKSFEKMNGIPCRMESRDGFFSLKIDKASDFILHYYTNDSCGGERNLLVGASGATSVSMTLAQSLSLMSGRKVCASISDTGFEVLATDLKFVPKIKHYGKGVVSNIPDQEDNIERNCGDCGRLHCIFLVYGEGCIKPSSYFAMMTLKKYFDKDKEDYIIGECAVVGHEDVLIS